MKVHQPKANPPKESQLAAVHSHCYLPGAMSLVAGATLLNGIGHLVSWTAAFYRGQTALLLLWPLGLRFGAPWEFVKLLDLPEDLQEALVERRCFEAIS